MPVAWPAGVINGDFAPAMNRDDDNSDIIGSDEHLVPNIIWYSLVSIFKQVFF